MEQILVMYISYNIYLLYFDQGWRNLQLFGVLAEKLEPEALLPLTLRRRVLEGFAFRGAHSQGGELCHREPIRWKNRKNSSLLAFHFTCLALFLTAVSRSA